MFIASVPMHVIRLWGRPPLAAFKWRHWGEMAGDLVCPMGPGMKLTAPATHQPLEIHGIGEQIWRSPMYSVLTAP